MSYRVLPASILHGSPLVQAQSEGLGLCGPQLLLFREDHSVEVWQGLGLELWYLDGFRGNMRCDLAAGFILGGLKDAGSGHATPPLRFASPPAFSLLEPSSLVPSLQRRTDRPPHGGSLLAGAGKGGQSEALEGP